MSLQTKVGIARTGTKSLRTTVPEGIVAFLELKMGDKLDWKMEIIDDQRVTIVSRVGVKEKEDSREKMRETEPKHEEALKIAKKYVQEGE